MGDRQHGSKPQQQSVISPSQAVELRQQVLDLGKRVVELEKTVNDKSQWNQMARSWIGSEVVVRLATRDVVRGKLVTLDRYTLVINGKYTDSSLHISDIIVHKGAVATIQQVI